jgi:hypothetical protein
MMEGILSFLSLELTSQYAAHAATARKGLKSGTVNFR